MLQVIIWNINSPRAVVIDATSVVVGVWSKRFGACVVQYAVKGMV